MKSDHQGQAIEKEANKIIGVLSSKMYSNGTLKSPATVDQNQKMAACAEKLFFPSSETAYKTGDEDLSYELTDLSKTHPDYGFEKAVVAFTEIHCPTGATSPLLP